MRDVNEGEFVQLRTWFGDVWAEVVMASGNMFKTIRYEKNTPTSYLSMLEFTDSIRYVKTKTELETMGAFRTDIVYAREGYWRYGQRIK